MTIRRDPNGQPMTIGFNGSEHFYLYNAQGDVVAIANYSGQVVVEYTYDAWGNPLSCTGSLADTLGRKNPFRYRGYVYDEETGLYYLKSRYYDPRVGRFICADSQLDKNAGLLKASFFTYCANNPAKSIDSTGHFTITIMLGGEILAFFGYSQYDAISIDFKGNIAFQKVKSGLSIDGTMNNGMIGLNIGGQIQFTNAQTVYDLNGKSTNIGASGGDGPYLGLDLISFSPPNDPNGKIDGISASAGLGIGLDMGHIASSNTETKLVVSLSDLKGSVSSFNKNIIRKAKQEVLSHDPNFEYYTSLNPLFYYSSYFRSDSYRGY